MTFDQVELQISNKDICYILGNSPTLAEENLKALQNHTVFITNKGWKATEIGLPHFDFYTVSDPNCAEENFNEIKELNCIKFISSAILRKKYLNNILDDKVVIFNRSSSGILKELPKTFDEGWPRVLTVIIDAIIISYLLGFKNIYLLGVNLDYGNFNTHFYKDSIGETERKLQIENNLNEILQLLSLIKHRLQDKNINIKNCSKNWKYKDII